MEKVEQLERKLGNELISLERNIDELRTAISSIGDVEVAQANAERMKTRQQIHLQELKARETSAERKLTEISTVYEKKRLALSENETFKHLSSQELKLKQIEGSNFELRDCNFMIDLDISVKNSQSNYNRVKGDVLRMTDEINSQLIKISQLAPAR